MTLRENPSLPVPAPRPLPLASAASAACPVSASPGRGRKAGIDHMALDDTSDGGEQGRNIFTLKPLATAWIKHGLELLDNKGHITAAPEDGADHPGQGDGPGVMLHIFGIDEKPQTVGVCHPERYH